jgi:tungstate transport system substrate-binding protein
MSSQTLPITFRRVRLSRLAILIATLIAAPLAAQAPSAGSRDVLLATTTSLFDTGLLDTITPLFERATGYHLRIVAVGSGQALKMGERGDADVIFAHSPAAEAAFMAAHHGTRRMVVATNYFTIVGPPADPAGVRAAPNVVEGLRRIAATSSVFVSRGDSSGTHVRELALWAAAGIQPTFHGYLETGQGQSATLLVADERRGYALTDLSTFGALRRRLDLVPLRERERALLNIYHVIEVHPEGRPRVNAAGARAFADFMVSETIQDLLESFGRSRFGEALFTPARGVEP